MALAHMAEPAVDGSLVAITMLSDMYAIEQREVLRRAFAEYCATAYVARLASSVQGGATDWGECEHALWAPDAVPPAALDAVKAVLHTSLAHASAIPAVLLQLIHCPRKELVVAAFRLLHDHHARPLLVLQRARATLLVSTPHGVAILAAIEAEVRTVRESIKWLSQPCLVQRLNAHASLSALLSKWCRLCISSCSILPSAASQASPCLSQVLTPTLSDAASQASRGPPCGEGISWPLVHAQHTGLVQAPPPPEPCPSHPEPCPSLQCYGSPAHPAAMQVKP